MLFSLPLPQEPPSRLQVIFVSTLAGIVLHDHFSPSSREMGQSVWDGDDFSVAFRIRVLNGILPLVLACLSAGILLSTFVGRHVYKALRRRRRHSKLFEHHGRSRSSPQFTPMPAVIIEDEQEHDMLQSQDLMLEAENAIIRRAVKEQGIVWPGAFRALGSLKEKPNHHIKPDNERNKYLAVPRVGENGQDDHVAHDGDSWVQFWKSPRDAAMRKIRKERARFSWRVTIRRLWKNGKKDFIQALLSWSLVSILYTKSALAHHHAQWLLLPAIVWTYFVLLLEYRQYSPIFHRSPFRPKVYTKLSYHVAPFMLAWCIIALLDFRTVLLSHAGKKEIAIEATTLSLSLVIFGMEVFTPQTANFMKKSELLRERAKEQAERRKGRRSRSDLGSSEHDDERRSLLGNQDGEDGSDAYDGGDTSDEEEADFLATLDILPHSSIQDEEERERKSEKVIPPPEVGQSLLALATFTYIGNFLFKHVRQPATFQDIPDLRADDKSASVVLEFRAASKTYPRWLRPMGASGMRKRPPIFWQLCYYFRHYMAAQIGWAFVKPWLAVMPPLFIRLILQWATDRSAGREAKPSVALLFVAGLFLTQMATSLVSSQSLIIGRRLCIRSKAILTAEVFTKTLRRKDLAGAALQRPGEADKKEGQAKEDDEKGPATAGRIQNLVSVDTSKVSEVFAYVHFFVPEAPLSKLQFFSPKIPADIVCLSSAIIVALGMLFNTIGYSAFAAVATMLILLPIQSGVARFFMRYQSQVLAAADKRLSLTTEVFQAIKVLKFFAWEGKFQQKLDEKREAELAALRKRVVVFAVGGISMFGAPIMISLVTFILHTKGFKQPLEATTAFTALALFNVIRSPLDQIANLMSEFLGAFISCARIDSLMEEEETAKYAVVATPQTAGDPKIGFVNASLTWDNADEALLDENAFKLQNLNLKFAIDGLNLVVGPVGSGKSSLLFALLGEMNLLNGRCFIPSPVVRDAGLDPASGLTDTVAFCSQTPWLLNDTIRNNILFGSAFNAKRYKHVLAACCLLPDLKVMDVGDQTLVGEKGTVLSGGQKARISLARAVYSSAKVLLLDDVLSAVDSHTGRNLYHNCLTSDTLMRSRTRIMVTHALHLTLPLADYMVAMANGHVAFEGPAHGYVQASGQNTPGIASGQDFSSLILKGSPSPEPPLATAALADAVAEQLHGDFFPHLDERPLHEETLFTMQEKQSVGAVSFGVYTFYGKAFARPIILLALIAIMTATEAAAVGSNWALRLWANSFDKIIHHARTIAVPVEYEPDHYLRIYITLAFCALALFGTRMFFYLWRGTVASKILYTDLMQSLLRASVRFYDTTPLGQVMNRLSKDMADVDQDVPASSMYFVLEIFGTGAVVVAIALAFPAFLLAGIFIGIGYSIVGWLYISSSREIKRIEAVTRSPVYSLVNECLTGVTSIRAYSDSSRFTGKLFNLVDDTNRPFFSLWLINRWLSVRSDFGGATVALVAALFIVMSPSVSASLAGFALTYALIMEERILWIVRLYASTQIVFNAVERIREYTLDISQEPQGGREPPAQWPSSQPSIQIENLVVRYAEHLDPALKGISLDVKPSERVAIVGRTGSGKSTLALSFFRFVEANKGRIVIDGIDIATLPLHTLRDRLTIIPQDAALFSGTVRFNLDPFGQFSDADLYDVLKRTNLVASGTATPGGSSSISSLDDPVQEGAKNFSAGQRQLLCLARGLLKLRNSNLLVLDESTANLDHETDVAIQETIRQELGDATVLCIAHRLHTIIDFDRVLVLSHGEVLEYDTPSALLAQKGSEFGRLCKETGDFDHLKEIADKHVAKT